MEKQRDKLARRAARKLAHAEGHGVEGAEGLAEGLEEAEGEASALPDSSEAPAEH